MTPNRFPRNRRADFQEGGLTNPNYEPQLPHGEQSQLRVGDYKAGSAQPTGESFGSTSYCSEHGQWLNLEN